MALDPVEGPPRVGAELVYDTKNGLAPGLWAPVQRVLCARLLTLVGGEE